MKKIQAFTPKIFYTLLLLIPGNVMLGQPAPQAPPPGQSLGTDQLDGLVAPIALYPDPLLSQILVASTYPLELVQASQWLQRNPGLTGPALTQAAQQQNWDPSIQALVVFPDLVKRLNQDITWTTNLGNAFLAQQSDVMDAVQRMRFKAQQAGARLFIIRTRVGFTHRSMEARTSDLDLGSTWDFISEEAGVVGADMVGVRAGAITASSSITASFTGTISTQAGAAA